jgi:catechol 2,3-dioxygenase
VPGAGLFLVAALDLDYPRATASGGLRARKQIMTLLGDKIEMGAVALGVGDLDRSVDYYRRAIGLELLERDGGRAVLGTPGRALLELEARPGGRRDERAADLFHFALLVPSREALGQQLQHFIDSDTRLTGASEHFVSEALYLRDPDGHGIEVYRDRPREDWYDGEKFLLGTAQLDVKGVLEAGGAAPGRWAGIDPGTVMGHIHLETTDLALSKKFYVDTLGFDVTMDMAQASFLSVGGYHHHLALNTWSRRTHPADRSGDAIALLHYEIRLPDRDALARLASGLGQDTPRDGVLGVDDPTGIRVRLSARA